MLVISTAGVLRSSVELPESDILPLVADIAEHLGVLVGYVEEQFRSTSSPDLFVIRAHRLEWVTSYGHIEVDLPVLIPT